MTERFWQFFFDHRRSALTIGRFLVRASLAVALIGLVTTSLSRAITTMRHGDPAISLVSFVPRLPTWWIPEHFPAYFLLAFFCAVGLSLVLVAKQLDRMADA